MKQTKKNKIITNEIKDKLVFKIDEAIETSKKFASKKFDETLDIIVVLGIDAKKSDQNVRGSLVLPNGTGKSVKVAVFCEGDEAKAAKENGADVIGMEDLAENIKKGEINFDILIATPDTMKMVGPLGQILGPKGLMPNPKTGTVSKDVAKAVKNAKSGQVQYRTDKAGIIHCSIGKVDFSEQMLEENLSSLIAELNRVKPASAKGKYLQKISVSSSMGLSLNLDQALLV